MMHQLWRWLLAHKRSDDLLHSPNLLLLHPMQRVQCALKLLLDLLQPLLIAECLLGTSDQDAEFVQPSI